MGALSESYRNLFRGADVSKFKVTYVPLMEYQAHKRLLEACDHIELALKSPRYEERHKDALVSRLSLILVEHATAKAKQEPNPSGTA